MLVFRVCRSKGAYMCVSLFMIVLISCGKKKHTKLEEIPFQAQMQSRFNQDIESAIHHLESLEKNLHHAKDLYVKSRTDFKRIEPVLSFLDIDNYGFLNQPNILKVEEEDRTDIKIKLPSGYQVLEEEIFAEEQDTLQILKHTKLTVNRLRLIKNNTYFDHLKPYHFLWMIRKAFIRVALTGITGFDSPVLENSIEESKIVYQSLHNYMKMLQPAFEDIQLYKQWNEELLNTHKELEGDFKTFDRYHFIKNHTHAQLKLWNRTVVDWQVTFPFELAINNDANSLFSNNTFNQLYFSDRNFGTITEEKVVLGKRLFYDSNLSKNKKISCATCHQPDKAFTDGLKIASGVTRNSPTLLYSSLQQAFFYDKRAGSLEGQIVSVITNENEFHTNLETLKKVVQKDTSYLHGFEKAYQREEIKDDEIRNAIATYIRTLVPFDSKFDRNMNGLENTITENEINGFNLFMGKAKCATCHFPPLFNGTVPPDYKETEMELIGVPERNDTINASISSDLGRFYVFQTPERKHFFKTATVRNVSKTAPYMHNGVYTTLEEVMDFYNRGGGNGIGIAQEYQTLPTDSLELSSQEIQDIILFMQSLEDKTST